MRFDLLFSHFLIIQFWIWEPFEICDFKIVPTIFLLFEIDLKLSEIIVRNAMSEGVNISNFFKIFYY